MTRFDRMKELGAESAAMAICNTMDCEDCPWFNSACMNEQEFKPENGWKKWLTQELKETEDII